MSEQQAPRIDLVVDANVLVALVDERDSQHALAAGIDAHITTPPYQLLYFDCLVAEAISVMARRAQERRRTSEFPELLNSYRQRVPHTAITWIASHMPRLYEQVLAIVEQSTAELNFNDAFIALVMREQGLQFLLSFDSDFDSCLG